MALDELAATIDAIRQRIEAHHDSLRSNETRTRQVLIDPLLGALGWDVADPSSVHLEYEAGGGRADYALISNGTPAVIIEAKKLNETLDNYRMQALTYANERGIKYAALSNGNTWQMYDVFRQAPLSERLVMELQISGDQAHVTALKALSLWRSNLSSDSAPVPASEPIFSSPEIKDTPITKNEPQDSVMAKTTTGVEPKGNWRDIKERGLSVKNTKPTALKIQGNVIDPPPQDWTSVLVNVANWLIAEDRFNPSAGYRKKPKNKRYLIHTEAVHGDGLKFRAEKKLTNGMFIETHGGASTCVSHCVYLLTEYGQGVSVEVKFNRT